MEVLVGISEVSVREVFKCHYLIGLYRGSYRRNVVLVFKVDYKR